jgi:hypothetical protein
VWTLTCRVDNIMREGAQFLLRTLTGLAEAATGRIQRRSQQRYV